MVVIDLRGRFLRDPVDVFLREIEQASRPVTFEEIKGRLVQDGLPDFAVTSQWDRYERAIKDDPHVSFLPETRTYAWGEPAVLPDAQEAVQRLASGKAQIKPDRKVLGDIVMAALQSADGPAPEGPRADARDQQIFEDRVKADSARAYAKVAMELEELIAGGASARVLLQRIHAAAQAYGLSPIGSAGATIRFDRLRHEPVVASIPDGSEVMIVRPGYVWRTGDEEVLVAKAVVVEQ